MFGPLKWLINNFLGNTEDTGGSATTGTIAAKVNKVITDLLDLINNRIGATSNTGGTATAGTAMAKLNNIQTVLGSVNTVNARRKRFVNYAGAVTTAATTTVLNIAGTGTLELFAGAIRGYTGTMAAGTHYIQVYTDGVLVINSATTVPGAGGKSLVVRDSINNTTGTIYGWTNYFFGQTERTPPICFRTSLTINITLNPTISHVYDWNASINLEG